MEMGDMDDERDTCTPKKVVIDTLNNPSNILISRQLKQLDLVKGIVYRMEREMSNRL